MVYSYDKALEASINYFNGDDLAGKVFIDKYALRNNIGEILEKTPVDMHRRLAREFARIENKYPNPLSEQEIFSYIDRFGKIIPQGSPMAGIGNPYQIMSLSNCEVISSPEDSYGGICYTDQELAQLMKRRCGVGFDISTIRPKGLSTNNAAKTTDGIAVFMERFSNTCREVAQNGRRGALLLSISVHHPEIETFINIKRDLKKVTGANISIRYSDEFMQAVNEDKEYELRFPVDYKERKITPLFTKKIKAQYIWEQVIDSNWQSAEPGSLYWDTVLKTTPAQAYSSKGFNHVSVNPCAELILSAYDSCRLLLVNTTQFVKNPFLKNEFDWEDFRKTSYIAQKLMDDIVDLELEHIDQILEKINKDPEPLNIKKTEIDLWEKIKLNCYNGRRTGTGLTGIGDTIAGLNMIYGDEESINFIEKLYKEFCLQTYHCSIDMAKDRGAFPVFDYNLEKEHVFLNQIWNEDEYIKQKYMKYGRRNIANTTTPPAGSTSILARLFNSNFNNITSGIESVYLLEYIRRKKVNAQDITSKVDYIDILGDKWTEHKVYHSGLQYWQNCTKKTNIKDSPYWGATSKDVNWLSGVKLQAAAQKWICHSISRTANLPNNIDKKLVSEMYLTAWKMGCKGYTIYREGSRSGVLVETTNTSLQSFTKRPKELNCDIYHVSIKGKPHTICISLYNKQPYEVLVVAEKTGRNLTSAKIIKKKRGWYDLYNNDGEILYENMTGWCNNEEGNITRLISTLLRHNVQVDYIVDQLTKMSGDINGFARSISRCLKRYIPENTTSTEKCEECENNLFYQEGCLKCQSCGWSKCS